MAPIEAKESIGLIASIVGFFVAIFRFPNWLHKTFAKREAVGQMFIDCQKNHCDLLRSELIQSNYTFNEGVKGLQEEMRKRDERMHQRLDEIYLRIPTHVRKTKKRRR